MARSIPALASTPGKTLTIPRSSTSGSARASAINRSLRGRRRSVDPLNEPARARDVLDTQHRAGGDAEIALLVLDRPFEDLELAADDVLLCLLDDLADRIRNGLVEGSEGQQPVVEPAIVIFRFELSRQN